jgi:hypothetical protein
VSRLVVMLIAPKNKEVVEEKIAAFRPDKTLPL